MDIENEKYRFISLDLYDNKPEKEVKKVLVKQTLLHSPIITNIITDFKVRINKPFKGVSSESFNDEEFQTLIPQEEDSQLDAFGDSDDDDDQLLFGVSNDTTVTLPEQSQQITPQFKTVEVIVKHTSIVVDGIEFSTKSAIRSSCVVKSSTNEDEHHLFISLKSGFLLLIRLYYVPRYYKDNSYEFQTNHNVDNGEGNSIFKPFVIQWWDTGSDQPTPGLESCGSLLKSSPSGLSTVAFSSSRSFRLYMTQSSTGGTVLRNHINIPMDGFLIDACFIEPNATVQTDMLFTLIFTETRRLTINLFLWSNVEGVWQGFSREVLPLENDTEIPVFVAPLTNNCSFLFVSPTKLTIVTIHDIISASYEFKTIEAPWQKSFPTTYHIPKENTSPIEIAKFDEVLISTDTGAIYSIQVIENSFGKCDPIIRVADSISHFVLEKRKENYRMIYASTGGSSKDILIPGLFSSEVLADISNMSKIPYTNAKLLNDFKPWAPLVDVSIIDSKHIKDSKLPLRNEIWGVGGIGRKSKLSQFRFGYTATKKSNTYEKLRKAIGLWKLLVNESNYLLCSLPFETILLEVQASSKDAFVEISDAYLITDNLTIYATVIQDNIIIQITNNSITLSDLVYRKISQFVEFSIVFCEVLQNFLILIVEDTDKQVKIKIYRIVFSEVSPTLEGDTDTDIFKYFELTCEQVLDFQPSMLKACTVKDEELTIAIGGFDGNLHFILFKDGELTILKTYDLIQFSNYSHDEITELSFIIPHDMIVTESEIIIGTQEGYYLKFDIVNGVKNNLQCKQFLRIGSTGVRLCPTSDVKLLLVYSDQLWLFNKYESEYPSRVYFDDNFERSILQSVEIENTKNNSKWKSLALIRDNGLVLVDVSTFCQPSIRQLSMPDNAKKLIYIPHVSTFLVLYHSNYANSRIKCVDKKSIKVVPHRETNIKYRLTSNMNGDDNETYIFQDDEIPISVCIWEVQRNGSKKSMTTKKILIGCEKRSSDNSCKTTGMVKVLDLKKIRSNSENNLNNTNNPDDNFSGVLITELTSFDHDLPVTNILQFNQNIIFTSEGNLYSTSYNELEKRFTPVKLFQTLPSRIISLYVSPSSQKRTLLVSTSNDSIYQFIETAPGVITYMNEDPQPKSFINQINYQSQVFAGDKIRSNITIINMNDDKNSRPFHWDRKNVQISGIARVYSAKLNNNWIQTLNTSINDDNNNATINDFGGYYEGNDSIYDDDVDNCVVGVSVNGEIVALRSISQDSNEINSITTKLGMSLEKQVSKLNRPFINKISGTGLLSLNKPKFDYVTNNRFEELVDYDLEELSSIHNSVLNL